MADRIQACARAELGTGVTADTVPLVILEAVGEQRTRGHHISLLFRCRLAGEPDPLRRATHDSPSPGQWRWHQRCPPDLLEAQRLYARYIDAV
jgi:hypothetical protein